MGGGNAKRGNGGGGGGRVIVKITIIKGYSSSLLKCLLRECGCRIGYEPTKMSRDHFWRSIPTCRFLHWPPPLLMGNCEDQVKCLQADEVEPVYYIIVF